MEWQLRNITAQKLVKYFSSCSFLDILDIGAGNCWLSNLISSQTENSVFALDLNEYELKQGVRAFSDNKRLKFIYGDIFDNNFNEYKFDVILFSSSIQYFPDLAGIIERSLFLLNPNGKIIITDSKFYNENELLPAKERTTLYYNELGFPEAAQNYFHHSYNDLNKFKVEILRDDSLLNKIFVKAGLKRISPFPLIKIYKQ
jgi:SAM-dependent methyltransferase